MKGVNGTVKVAKQAVKWRDSASLIILSKNSVKVHDNADYKVLLFNRNEKASFFPTTSVFPGGVCDSADQSPLWLKHFQSMNLSDENFRDLILKRNLILSPQPEIFQTKDGDHLQRDLSLRITAIRETFEEMGILIARGRQSVHEDNCGLGNFYEDFDRSYWQCLVHEDGKKFLNLCEKLEVVPDLQSLYEWSVWLTPADKKKRFETAFYLVALKETPTVVLEEKEGLDFKWLSPKDALIANMKNEIVLAPPQIWELSRLLNFQKFDDVHKFAKNRAVKGTIRMQPSRRQCKDGLVSLLPGDSDYPLDPNATNDLTSIDTTMQEYRKCAEKLHRFEFERPNYGIAHVNFDPIDGHLKPLNLK